MCQQGSLVPRCGSGSVLVETAMTEVTRRVDLDVLGRSHLRVRRSEVAGRASHRAALPVRVLRTLVGRRAWAIHDSSVGQATKFVDL